MKNIISVLKELSRPGVLAIHLGDRKIRIVSSSNIVSSLQRILPELSGQERIEVLSDSMPDKSLRSLMCYVHKVRLSRMGYNVVKCSVKKWWIDKRVEELEDGYSWVVRLKNTYGGFVIGVFDKEGMDVFLKTYYPGGMISSAIISSNDATRRYYEIHPEG